MNGVNKTPVFNIVILVFFGVLALAGFVSFSIYGSISRGGASDSEIADLVIWGTFSKTRIDNLIGTLIPQNPDVYRNIEYIEKNVDSLEGDLLRAFASGVAPDILLLQHEYILEYEEYLEEVPYSIFSLNNYQESFVSSGDIFLKDSGFLAFPFLVDPIVLFYNENISVQNRITSPPSKWSDLYRIGNAVVRDGARINTALIPLGGSYNYKNSPDLLSTLFLQSGNEILKRDQYTGEFTSLSDYVSNKVNESVLDFYTQFADPSLEVYTWNSALREARDLFIEEKLLFYPGFASEREIILRSNPNLPFIVSTIPQTENAKRPTTFASVYGLSVTGGSKYKQQAISVIYDFLGVLSGDPEASVSLFHIPPAVEGFSPPASSRQYWSKFVDSALISKNWYNPNKIFTDSLFRNGIQNIVSNIESSESVVDYLNSNLLNYER